jgi:Flp pilus assembly protein TadG
MRRLRHLRDESGAAATSFVVGMAVVLLACAGLVVDGGTALNARMKLADEVEQAARAGAQEIDEVTLRQNGQVRLDVPAAGQRARTYLASLGHPVPAVDAQPTYVTVTADDVVRTRLLGLIGIDSFDIHATATAEAETQ